MSASLLHRLGLVNHPFWKKNLNPFNEKLFEFFWGVDKHRESFGGVDKHRETFNADFIEVF